MLRFACLPGVALFLAACSKPVDARARAEVEAFLGELVQSAASLDIRGFAERFRAECPVTIHFQGKTKRTTLELYCRSLEENRDRIEKNDVELLEVKVEERKEGGYLARTKARESSLVSGRTVEGESRSRFEIERTPEGLRVVAYEDDPASLPCTKCADPGDSADARVSRQVANAEAAPTAAFPCGFEPRAVASGLGWVLPSARRRGAARHPPPGRSVNDAEIECARRRGRGHRHRACAPFRTPRRRGGERHHQ